MNREDSPQIKDNIYIRADGFDQGYVNTTENTINP